MTERDTTPTVTILLASYNGAQHITEQLESIGAQTHENWRLIVSDDGSTDSTRDLVAQFAASFPKGQVTLIEGPKRGASSANFMSLMNQYNINSGEYVAFCDQDDVWYVDRLARGLNMLSPVSPEDIALYGSRTKITDEQLNPLGLSPLFERPQSFANALVQNFAGGNTMLMTPGAADELALLAGQTREVVAHDWWAYLIVSALGGQIFYDPVPTLFYRQHDANLIGSNMGFRAQMRRVRGLFDGQYKRWNRTNITALRLAVDRVSPDIRARIDMFEVLNQASGLSALRKLSALGLYRQTNLSQFALWLGAFLGRL
ncbi:glycosyltransferase family 2 protein [Celeribacter sp. PS-C1]|uniref:glycosyltransferase family 2 protein n=1 Tax=Celeribacter sp. PS-C1 TaxID=2820813 RepID=UPI001C67DEA1|nr:glycosyltransferase family 2 protein [Celeribacter sp. PS-C1]MBW6416194.1 glycosyltransferase family 2 protein [Celeribacter sp. PS-C1]